MADFVIMPQDGAYFSFSGQDALQAASQADCRKIGSASCAAQAGMLSMTGTDLNDCFQKLRALIGYLPDNSDCEAPAAEAGDDYARRISAEGFGTFEPYDVKRLIEQIADEGTWTELSAEYAPNAVTGFAKIGDCSVCIVANRLP